MFYEETLNPFVSEDTPGDEPEEAGDAKEGEETEEEV